MAAFSAAALVTKAKSRYGAAVLEGRMRGAGGNATNADIELGAIAGSVISRVAAACLPSVGWPLPGTWPAGSLADDGITSIAGTAYTDIWPENLLQMALDLFNWRTVSGLDSASSNQRAVGQMAEKFFTDLEMGAIALGIGGASDVTASDLPLTARNRDGSSNDSNSSDTENLLDGVFSGRAWDGPGFL
jgi:hypothetical protein